MNAVTATVLQPLITNGVARIKAVVPYRLVIFGTIGNRSVITCSLMVRSLVMKPAERPSGRIVANHGSVLYSLFGMGMQRVDAEGLECGEP